MCHANMIIIKNKQKNTAHAKLEFADKCASCDGCMVLATELSILATDYLY